MEKKKKWWKQLKIFNAYVISSVSITFVLILVGIMFLMFFNVKHLVRTAKSSIQLTVLLDRDAPESRILLFQKELDKAPFTNYTEYISSSQALEDMKEFLGSDIVDLLDYNPLPPIINIYMSPKYSSYDSLQSVSNYLLSRDIVDDVFFNKTLIYQLNENIKLVSAVLGVIAFLLFLIALALINNTIRLLVYSKRQEIKTMQLVGASDWFIMKPFIWNSVFQGVASGLVAAGIIILSLVFIQSRSKMSFMIYNLEITIFLIILIGIFITGFATYLAVKHYLWAKDDEIWS